MLKLNSINGGKLNTWYDRSMKYFNLIRSMMMVAIFTTIVEWSWWYLAIIPVILILIYYDVTVMFGQQTDYSIEKSQTWQELLKKLDDIHKKLMRREY